MSFKKKPTGDKCLKCLDSKHLQCVAWTCMCTFCVSTVEKQREKTLRLEEYWRNRNLSEETLEFDPERQEKNSAEKGRTRPHKRPDNIIPKNKNTFKKSDDFYDEFLVQKSTRFLKNRAEYYHDSCCFLDTNSAIFKTSTRLLGKGLVPFLPLEQNCIYRPAQHDCALNRTCNKRFSLLNLSQARVTSGQSFKINGVTKHQVTMFVLPFDEDLLYLQSSVASTLVQGCPLQIRG